MCFGFKMTLKNGDEVCIPYYVQERQWPPIPPEELDPLGKIIFDINTVTAISQAVANIQDAQVRDQLTAAIQENFGALSSQLPDSVRVEAAMLGARG